MNILLLTLACSLTACYEDDSCSQNTDTGINVAVSNKDGDYKGYDLWSFSKVNDTVSFVSSENQTYEAGIPLNINDTSITFLFNIRLNDTTAYLSDTITINYYQTDLRLLSVNCGFAPVYHITGGSHTLNVLDSVILYDEEISSDLELDNAAFYY